jgi:hypothetical protein
MNQNQTDDNWIINNSKNDNFIFVEINRKNLQKVGNDVHLYFDKLPRSEKAKIVHNWMDKVPGRGHRIVHGHGIENIKNVYDNFGADGVLKWFQERSYDSFSTDGLPVPFADDIANILGLSTGQTIQFLTYNIIDVFSGLLSMSTAFDTNPGNLAINTLSRLIAYSLTGNPVLLLSAGVLFTVALFAEDDRIVKCHRTEWGNNAKIVPQIAKNIINTPSSIINIAQNIIEKKR